MADILTATSMTPLRIYGQLPTTAAAIYAAPAGTGAILMTGSLENASGSPVLVSLAIVRSGDSGDDDNWIFNEFSLPSGAPLDLGALGPLDEGDFIWVEAGTASAVTLNIGGFKFSSTTTGTPAGINLDAVSPNNTGRGFTSPQVTTIKVGTGANRDLLAFVAVGHNAGVDTAVNQFGYDTLTVSSSLNGAMTRLLSARYGAANAAQGTLHIFGYAAPASGDHTLTATASKSGLTIDAMQIAAESWTGVASRSGATAFNATAAANLNAGLSSAAGKRAVFAVANGGLRGPTDFNCDVRHCNGPDQSLFGEAEWLTVGDLPGAPTVTATTAASPSAAPQSTFAVGINLDAA